MLEKIKSYAIIVGGYLLLAFSFLTYIFTIKEKNKELIESNNTLQAQVGQEKTLAELEGAKNDADKKEADYITKLNAYRADGSSGGDEPPSAA